MVREKLVQPVAVQPINSLESVNHTISNTEIALPKPKPVKKLMMGKAKGWKVLRKRIERREFTEDLRQSNLQLNRMDEKSPMLRFDHLASNFVIYLSIQSTTEKIRQIPNAQSRGRRPART